jgi:hypothetical protein
MIAVFLCVLPSGLSLRVEDQRGAAERVGRLYFLGLDSWCPGVLAVRFISDWLCLLLSHWSGTGRRVRMVVMAPFARFVWLSPGASSDSARGESPLGRNEARARTSVQLMERRGPPRRCNAGGKAGGSPGESWFPRFLVSASRRQRQSDKLQSRGAIGGEIRGKFLGRLGSSYEEKQSPRPSPGNTGGGGKRGVSLENAGRIR